MSIFSSFRNAIGGLIGDITGASQAADGASQAAATQAGAAQAGINEQRRQFDITQQNLAPFLRIGQGAAGGLGDLAGLGGQDAQAAAIAAIQGGPQFAAMQQLGQDSILANASATGGLRGGNTQGALGQFSPQLLSSLINDRFSQLGGLASLGAGTGTSLGGLGANSANSVSQLLQQQGAATAGGQIAQGGVNQSAMGSLFKLGGAYLGGGF